MYYRFLFMVSCMVAFLGGCASHPKLEPTATTYPANKRTEVTNIINIPIPILANVSTKLTGGSSDNPTKEKIDYSPGAPAIRSSYKQTVFGDSAEEELWIVPRNAAEVSEARLMARLDEGGKKSCKGAFLLKDTHYYYGTEGTLKFVGIKTPALNAVYRCQTDREPVDDPDFREVAKLATQFTDQSYFDISSFIIPRPQDKVVGAVNTIIEQREINVVMDKQNSLTHTIIASGTTRGTGGTVPEHLVMVIRPIPNGSKVTLMQMRYQKTSHERGVSVAGTGQPGFSREARPFARDVAYDYSRMLAGRISDLAGSNEKND